MNKTNPDTTRIDYLFSRLVDKKDMGEITLWKNAVKELQALKQTNEPFFKQKRPDREPTRNQELKFLEQMLKKSDKFKEYIIKYGSVLTDIEDYYALTRKIIRSKALTKKEASHVAIMFADATMSRLPKKSTKVDDLYNRLLNLISKTYSL